jgi:hypothetical protein
VEGDEEPRHHQVQVMMARKRTRAKGADFGPRLSSLPTKVIRIDAELVDYYPKTSLTLRDKFCNVKGFCRKAVPLSMVPSFTIASSV